VVKQPEIGGLIREVRLLAGLTQELFAEYLNVTSVTYGTINCWKMDDSETSAVGDRQPLPLAMHKIRQKAIGSFRYFMVKIGFKDIFIPKIIGSSRYFMVKIGFKEIFISKIIRFKAWNPYDIIICGFY